MGIILNEFYFKKVHLWDFHKENQMDYQAKHQMDYQTKHQSRNTHNRELWNVLKKLHKRLSMEECKYISYNRNIICNWTI